MKMDIDPWWRWVFVPISAIGAGLISGWLVKAATLYLSVALIDRRVGPSGHFVWHLIVAPGLESASLAWSFVWAGRSMAPRSKIGTEKALTCVLVGAFLIPTMAVWILEPTTIVANLRSTVGTVAAYCGAILAFTRERKKVTEFA